MKMRFEFSGDAEAVTPQRGAAPVGVLQDLPPLELAAIVYLRAWCEAGADRRMIAQDFRLVMGDAMASAAAEDFDALIRLVLANTRRPLMRHGLGCKCFGGDESAFANMIAAAAGQDRDDTLLFASTLMTGHAVWAAVQMAERLGQPFLRLARAPMAAQRRFSGPPQRSYRH